VSDAAERRADALALARTLQLTSAGPTRALAESVAALIRGLGDAEPVLWDQTVAELATVLRQPEAAMSAGLVQVQRSLVQKLAAETPVDRGGRARRFWRRRTSDPAATHADAAPTESGDALLRVAVAYGRDAGRRGWLGLAVAVLALLIAAVATFIGWEVMDRAASADQRPSRILAFLLLPAVLFVAAGLVAHQAAVIRRGAHELQRLERQFQAVDAYLEPLPVEARHLMRAALAQRLFPRMIEDDPLRDEDWFPQGSDLRELITGESRGDAT
jgi:hypothetical protein